jgi:hypothetical protein
MIADCGLLVEKLSIRNQKPTTVNPTRNHRPAIGNRQSTTD